MQFPPNWNNLSLREQEIYLVEIYQKKMLDLDNIKKMLAKIRGGKKIEA